MREPERPYKYGDFPELFWDLQKDVLVDGTDPLIIARVLREGNLEHVKKIVSIEALMEHFDEMVLPRNVRIFWTMLIADLRRRGIGTPA